MSTKKFTQVECLDYLQRCTSQDETLEVLLGYCFVKYRKHSTAQVYRKLQVLVCGLRVYRLHRVIQQFPQAFLICAYHVEILHGTLLASCPTNTKLGREVGQLVDRICGAGGRRAGAGVGGGEEGLRLTQSIMAREPLPDYQLRTVPSYHNWEESISA